ncbi:MAG: hypothetical protein ACJ746_07975 [Bryobacteraceae bacterium]
MTALEQLNAYLKRLEGRIRLYALSRGAAFVFTMALALTVFFVWISNRYAFAQGVVLPLRIALFLLLAAGISLLLVRPVLRLTRRRVTDLIEQRAPEFQERLLTLTERNDASNPWDEVLAEDALKVAELHTPETLTPTRPLLTFAGAGAIALAVLLWLIVAGPGYWGYGAGLLWTGHADAAKKPLYDITVQPGDKTIRRKADQIITATLQGFSADHVTLHAKYGSTAKWDQTPMQVQSDGDRYRFLFAGLSDTVEYYVQADKAQSKHFTIHVKDFPAVKRVRVALRYPAGLDLENVVLDPAGDIRAVDGTTAEISVLTDRPLENGILVTDDGKKLTLEKGDGNWSKAVLKIEKDGSYHIAALDNAEPVRISDDYFIEAKKDEAPTVKILKPGRDPHVSPIEELPVSVTAADDFAVKGLDLHYSVNGGEEQVVPLLKAMNPKEADGGTTLYFENLKVAPGDLVSFYATAKDAKTTAKSEIIFAQAEPFDFKFSQSQQAGGGGGGGAGNQSDDISQRQKQIIAATFNETKEAKPKAALAEDAKFLSGLQAKLGEQAQVLAERMGNREMGSSGPEFQQFSKLMTQASSDMGSAVEQLRPGKWRESLVPEQKALGSLLRAEALFRDIQVAFGQSGGGGGGASGAQRDLARMFDLELDTTKNQYETGQSSSADSAKDAQKAMDEAYERLQALAKRQEELAAQNAQQQVAEQRWQEEQLRREAEELRKQMQELAKNSQGQNSQSQQGSQSSQSQSGSQGSQSQSASGSSSSQSSGGRQGAQSASSRNGQSSAQSAQNRADEQRTAESMRRVTEALGRAENEMRKAVSNGDATARDRALNQIREAQDLMNRMMHDQAGRGVGDLANRASQLAEAQKSIADRLKQMYGDTGSNSRAGSRSLGGGESMMPEMNDPNSMRFGYGFRRRYYSQPGHEPSQGEKSLADEKDRLAKDVESLEHQVQQQAQALAGTRPDAARKLSRALSEAEQKDLAVRMQKNAEWMRQGYGDRNLATEDSVTAGLQQLSRDLRDADESLQSAGAQNGQKGGNDQTARALSEIRSLREDLERKAGQNGAGQSQGGQQQASQRGGQQSGQQNGGQAGEGGEMGGERSGYGPLGGYWSPRGGGGRDMSREDIQSAIAQLRGLRNQAVARDRALTGYIDGALGNLQHLTGAQDGLLEARISQDALTSLQRLEAELGKRVAQQQNEGTRTGAHEDSPEKYHDAVAGYFRRLSQAK